MKKLRLVILFSSLLLLANTAKSQYNRVLSASNFGGVSNVNFNPAIADNKFKFDMNLISFGLDAGNNYVGFKNKVFTNKSYFTDGGDFNQYLKERVNGNPKRAYVNINAQMPLSFMVSWGKNRSNKNALAFTYNINSLTNIDNISETLARSAYHGFGQKADSITGFNGDSLKEKNIAIRSLNWADAGITYSRVVYDKGAHFVKVGGTIKFLMGFASAYFYSDNADYKINNFDSLNIYNSDVKFGHSKGIQFLGGGDFNASDITQAFSYSAAGDLGAVYEWRPDKDKYKYEMDCKSWWYNERDKYKLAVGFSIIDIGALKFDKSGDDRNFKGEIRDWRYKEEPWKGIASFDSILNAKFPGEEDNRKFTVWLPTRFNVYLDYHIWKGFGLNLQTTISPVMAKSRNQVHYPTSVTLTPKYDHKWAGVYIPISYDEYGNFSAGAGLRVGPLFVTSSNIITLYAKQYSYNFNIQAGLKITIPNCLHKDKDKDGVSNKLDKCKKDKGTCATEGCPDRDKDGVVDSKDKCPAEPGLKELKGCPDRDGDSIPDKDDECPDDKGLAELNGCPDRDGDKVIDKNDLCPDAPGSVDHSGCPDTDGDGLYDNEDDCPTVAGPVENKGCPWPDTDGDGVPDKDDKCVTVKGPASNSGCPVLEKKEVEALKFAFENLEFETGKDVIRTKSYPSLDSLSSILKAKANYFLIIEGHTDNVGKAPSNQTLSEKRATAVKNYLVKRGVNAANLSASGFGQTKPIADNKTAAGRQKNRRVEMRIDIR